MSIVHYHFVVWAADSMDEKTGEVKGLVVLRMIADDEKEALARAKKMIERPKYRVSEVVECGEDHDIQRKQLENQQRMTEAIISSHGGQWRQGGHPAEDMP